MPKRAPDRRYSGLERILEAALSATVVTGGFPCQDLSVAGKGAGIDGARSGLWSEMRRTIGLVRPQIVIVENVPALLSGDGGRWFQRVAGDLAALGYDLEWHCIPAADVGAPHRRDRIWILAYAPELFGPALERDESDGVVEGDRVLSDTDGTLRDGTERRAGRRDDIQGRRRTEPGHYGASQPLADAKRQRREWRQGDPEGSNEDRASSRRPQGANRSADGRQDGDVSDASSKRCGQGRSRRTSASSQGGDASRRTLADADVAGLEGPDLLRRGRSGTLRSSESLADPGQPGLPPPEQIPLLTPRRWEEGRAASERGWWTVEPKVGRVADGVPSRVDRLKGLGNAVVPVIPEIIGRIIMKVLGRG